MRIIQGLRRADGTVIAILFMSLLFPCGIALGIGIATFTDQPVTAAVLIAPIVVWALLGVFVIPRFLAWREGVQGAQDKQQAEDLFERINSQNESVPVPGWSSLAGALVLPTPALILMILGYRGSNAMSLLAGACLLLASGIYWIDVFPRLLKPMFRIRRDGLQTAEYGFIAWQDITGMQLDHRPARFCDIYVLTLSVPHRHELMRNAHPSSRFLYDIGLYRRRHELAFVLTQHGRRARVIAVVAEFLWRAQVGWMGGNVPRKFPPAAAESVSVSAQPPPHHQPHVS